MDDQQTNNTNINMQSAPVNPQQNVATSSALDERISQQPQSKKSSKSKIIIFVFLILFLVLVGVGGWWYYAQGQAWLMLKQSSWNWGVDALENYQQDTSLYLSISTKTKEGQSDAYFMFPGDQKFYIDLTSSQKNISQNMEADTTLTAKGENFDLNVGFKSKKIDDKVYLSLNLGNLSELAAGMIALPDFGDIWFEMDVENSYNITLDKEKLAQVNIKFNDFLDKLKSDGIFDIKDLKNDDNGFRKIQLNVKENKIDDFVLAAINYGADVYEVVSDVDTNSSEYKDYRQSNIQIFEDLKNEKPADWEKIKKIFESIDFVILLNENTKAIHGLEIYLNNIISDDNSLSTIINGNIKYFIKSIDAYDIVKPNNIKSIDNFQDIFTSSTMDIDEYNGPLLTPDDPGFYDNHTIDKIDSDSDGLSDML